MSRSTNFRRKNASATLHLGDGIAWMKARKPRSIHAIVTDPPYGFREYTKGEQRKLRKGRGGVWRIPPKLDGHTRSPLPRFTVLTNGDIAALEALLTEFARAAL